MSEYMKQVKAKMLQTGVVFSAKTRHPALEDEGLALKRFFVEPAQLKELIVGAQISSVIARQELVNVVNTELGLALEASSEPLTFTGHVVLVQYSGPQLPDGATTLPEGASIEWGVVLDMSLYS